MRIDEQREIIPKGPGAPLKIHKVDGSMGEPLNHALEEKDPFLAALERRVPLLYIALDGKVSGFAKTKEVDRAQELVAGTAQTQYRTEQPV